MLPALFIFSNALNCYTNVPLDSLSLSVHIQKIDICFNSLQDMTLVSLQLRSTTQSRLNTHNINGDFAHFSAHISIVTGYIFVATETFLTK